MTWEGLNLVAYLYAAVTALQDVWNIQSMSRMDASGSSLTPMPEYGGSGGYESSEWRLR
jgi:hypothetical protein